MIVTCPGCASKYRVRNEAVPAEGARMRCPKCETLFLARPPPPGGAAEEPGGGFDAPTGQFVAMGPGLAGSPPPGLAAPAGFAGFSAPPGTGPSSSVVAFGASTGASLLPSPSPFDGASRGGHASAGPVPSPFGAPSPSPFGAPSPSPFGAPSPSPFGASPFGGMPPAAPRPPDDDDPFANVDLDVPARPVGEGAASGIPAPSLALSTAAAAVPSPPRPAAQGPSAPRPPLPAPVPALTRARPHGSLAAQVASWLFLLASAASAGAGALFAAWTSGAVDLDERLMPLAEAHLGVRPPYSFVGRDEPAVDELRRQAKAREDAGDLPAAAVVWRRILDHEPTDATAKTALPRVLTALGERLR